MSWTARYDSSCRRRCRQPGRRPPRGRSLAWSCFVGPQQAWRLSMSALGSSSDIGLCSDSRPASVHTSCEPDEQPLHTGHHATAAGPDLSTACEARAMVKYYPAQHHRPSEPANHLKRGIKNTKKGHIHNKFSYLNVHASMCTIHKK